MAELTGRLSRPDSVIAYADSGGEGPAIVFTHGAGLDHSMFDDAFETLAQRGYRVITWDLRGHGRSALAEGVRFDGADALSDLDALLEACAVREPVLIGHSLGGNLVQAYADAHPDHVRGVIVVDAAWNVGPLSWFERWGLRIAAPALTLIPARRLPGIMARASAVTSDAIARAELVFARMPKASFLDIWRATVGFIDPAPQRRLPVHLALVRGAEDRTGNISTAMPKWARAEGLREYVIPHAGHIVTWDAPDSTNRVLIEILESWGQSKAAR
ncbi:alpha/beta fold hydrolase [Microbacterium sp. NPDC055903]